MAKFKDKEGSEWRVRITAGHLVDLKSDYGIDLADALKPGDQNTLAEAIGEPEKFGQLLWFFCGAEAEKAGLTPEEFVHRLDADAVQSAAVAMWDATLEFFQPGTAKAGRLSRLVTSPPNESTSLASVSTSLALSASTTGPSVSVSSPKWPTLASVPSGIRPAT